MPLDELGFETPAAGRLQCSHEALEARAAELRAAPREVAARGGFVCTSMRTRKHIWRSVADAAAERAGGDRRYDGAGSRQWDDRSRQDAHARRKHAP